MIRGYGQLHRAVLDSMNADMDALEQAVDQLVCQDVDLDRIARYSVSGSPTLERGLLVDGKRAFKVESAYVRAEDQHLIVTRGGWLGEWGHLNPKEEA